MNTKEIYKFLGTNDALIKIALLTGFIQTLRCSNFLESPLSSLCFAIIIAIIYSLLAELVISICPDFLKPMISIILIFSMLYYVFLKDNCLQIVDLQTMKSGTQIFIEDGKYYYT